MVPLVVVTIAVVTLGVRPAQAIQVSYYDVPHGAHPHDVAPAPDGTVWYTAQHQGAIGILDPKTGKVSQVSLGPGAAPHGVIVGPDRAAWITEGGQGIRPLRDHHDTGWRGLVRVACRRSHRQNRYRERRRFDGAASQVRGGAATHLVGFQRAFVGEFLEQWR